MNSFGKNGLMSHRQGALPLCVKMAQYIMQAVTGSMD